ncbi:MAG: MASE3 domain-containing protein [Desulfurivibrio sp.]|nr:MASE3 domain-containing protein [Desulfurivibrio sp.]
MLTLQSIIPPANERGVVHQLVLLALLLLVLVAAASWTGLLVVPDFLPVSIYLAFHAAGELFAVVVALLIFTTGFHAPNKRQNTGTLIMACAFLGVGIIDFLHTLSYPGMNDFLTANTTHKSILLWLTGRFLATFALLALVWPGLDIPGRRPARWIILTGTLLITAICGYIVVFQSELIPATYIPGHGLTTFKIVLEWLLIALNLLIIGIILRFPERYSPSLRLFLAPALLILAAGGLYFASYQDTSDGLILLGHTYKVLGYLLIYRAIFLENIHRPYQELHQAQKKLSQLSYALDQVAEAVYLIDREGCFQYVNRTASRLMGYHQGELRDAGVDDIDHDFPMGKWPDHWQELQAKGNLVFEARHHDHHGRVFPVEINANYFEYEGQGYNLALVRDITDRKQAEKRDPAGRQNGGPGLDGRRHRP